MANAMYGKFKEFMIDALLTGNVKCALVDAGAYTLNIDTHDFLDDIPSVIATSGNLAGKSVTLGVFDANDITITGVSGATVEYVVIYIDTGTPATSRLVAILDTATGLTLTPSGGDVILTWDNGANKIFKV